MRDWYFLSTGPWCLARGLTMTLRCLRAEPMVPGAQGTPISLPLKPDDNLACTPSYALALPSFPSTLLTAPLAPHPRLTNHGHINPSHWPARTMCFILSFCSFPCCSLTRNTVPCLPLLTSPLASSSLPASVCCLLLAEPKRRGHCLGSREVAESPVLCIPEQSIQTVGLELRDSNSWRRRTAPPACNLHASGMGLDCSAWNMGIKNEGLHLILGA